MVKKYTGSPILCYLEALEAECVCGNMGAGMGGEGDREGEHWLVGCQSSCGHQVCPFTLLVGL